MRAIAACVALLFASPAFAHGGGLNLCGCHFERKTGKCHCHQPSKNCDCECRDDKLCKGQPKTEPEPATK
jgi:hypothetical protein